ncbi:MAG: type II toxin-antitoxin system ParD family antitoxin [Balneolaceae bacterium]|nr:type II toxin-antitoxin system ParD family antitoxin [Balneolaceae bacterium]
MNVSLTKKQEEYITKQIDTGDFQNASELVRDAIRLHQFYRERVLKELKLEIEKGWEGPISSKTVQEIVKERKQAHNV